MLGWVILLEALKQLGLALTAFHDNRGRFPLGSENTGYPTPSQSYSWWFPRITWALRLYPYVEQNNAYTAYDFTLPPSTGAAQWFDNANSQGPGAPTSLVVPVFLCPADGLGGSPKPWGTHGTFAVSNYLAFFGDKTYGGNLPWAVAKNVRHAFGWNFGARLAEITDGTSSTMALGEYLTGVKVEYDIRGVVWYDHAGSSQIYTQFTPNAPNPDSLHPSWPTSSYPEQNLPSVLSSGSDGTHDTAAVRSRHPGGVNVVFADGSVHFVNQNISLATWQALGSIDAGEVAGSY